MENWPISFLLQNARDIPGCQVIAGCKARGESVHMEAEEKACVCTVRWGAELHPFENC